MHTWTRTFRLTSTRAAFRITNILDTYLNLLGIGFEADSLPAKVGPRTCHINRHGNRVATLSRSPSQHHGPSSAEHLWYRTVD